MGHIVFVVEVRAAVKPTVVVTDGLQLVSCLVTSSLCCEVLLWLSVRRAVAIVRILLVARRGIVLILLTVPRTLAELSMHSHFGTTTLLRILIPKLPTSILIIFMIFIMIVLWQVFMSIVLPAPYLVVC